MNIFTCVKNIRAFDSQSARFGRPTDSELDEFLSAIEHNDTPVRSVLRCTELARVRRAAQILGGLRCFEGQDTSLYFIYHLDSDMSPHFIHEDHELIDHIESHPRVCWVGLCISQSPVWQYVTAAKRMGYPKVAAYFMHDDYLMVRFWPDRSRLEHFSCDGLRGLSDMVAHLSSS